MMRMWRWSLLGKVPLTTDTILKDTKYNELYTLLLELSRPWTAIGLSKSLSAARKGPRGSKGLLRAWQGDGDLTRAWLVEAVVDSMVRVKSSASFNQFMTTWVLSLTLPTPFRVMMMRCMLSLSKARDLLLLLLGLYHVDPWSWFLDRSTRLACYC